MKFFVRAFFVLFFVVAGLIASQTAQAADSCKGTVALWQLEASESPYGHDKSGRTDGYWVWSYQNDCSDRWVYKKFELHGKNSKASALKFWKEIQEGELKFCIVRGKNSNIPVFASREIMASFSERTKQLAALKHEGLIDQKGLYRECYTPYQ